MNPSAPAAAAKPRARKPPAPQEPARQIVVVDCGTSSVRAFIAEIRGAQQRILEDIHYPVNLTPTFTEAKLDRGAMDGLLHAFAGIEAVAKSYGARFLRAVATSVLREASNSDVMVEQIRSRLGLELEIIESAEESRLYFAALRQLVAKAKRRLSGNMLLIDVGGGSTSIGLIRGGKLVHSVDEHYGTARLCESFRDFTDSTDFCITIDRYSHGAVSMMLGRLPSTRVNHIIVTGSDVRRLHALLAPEAKGPIEPLDAGKVESWFARMRDLMPMARAKACNSDAQHASLLLPAASFIRHLCAQTGIDVVQVPQLTLRDGLMADLLPGAHGPHSLDSSHLTAEAEHLLRRYGGNSEYARNTAALALQIYDQTAELHHLGDRVRALLEFSALTHDIGSYLNVRNRHKHSMYIIQSADIAGLSSAEKIMVAHIARYHRRSPPQPHHQAFQSMPRRNRVIVAHCAAILRIAYALDVERTQRIRAVRCEVSRGQLLLHVDRRQIALEQWAVARKSEMFGEVFGLKVSVVPRSEE